MISVLLQPPRGLVTGLGIVNVSLIGNNYECPEIISLCHARGTSPSLLPSADGRTGAWGGRSHVCFVISHRLLSLQSSPGCAVLGFMAKPVLCLADGLPLSH